MPLPALTDDIIDQILLRYPPQEPELLVRAALVCKRWFRLISDPSFRRRFREYHRAPPMLGLFCTDPFSSSGSLFVPISTAPLPCAVLPVDGRAIDARHGRVLLNTAGSWDEYSFNCSGDDLVVWDPITGEHHRLPKLLNHMYPRPYPFCCSWTAAVLCAETGGGCNHLDCHRGPFLVVFVCASSRETFASVYSSEAGAWSGPASAQLRRASVHPGWRSAVVGNALFFMSDDCGRRKRILKHVLGTQEISTVHLPRTPYRQIALMTTSDGVLGFAAPHESKLYMWSRVSGTKGYAGWAQRQAIDLQSLLLPIGTLIQMNSLYVLCFVDGAAAIVTGKNGLRFAIDLKSGRITKLGHRGVNIVPYMSFYTPGLVAVTTCVGPRAGAPSA